MFALSFFPLGRLSSDAEQRLQSVYPRNQNRLTFYQQKGMSQDHFGAAAQAMRGEQPGQASDVVPTVFVVDDDPAVVKGLSRLLRAARLEAATFTSPLDFLARFDPKAPGCLVLDLSMPDLNGLELQEALMKKGGSVPIIFLTGHCDVPDGLQVIEHGPVDFLTKPVNDEDLLKAIHAAIEQDRLARQARDGT
jgi:CheY-like chemotaxis protein